MRCKGLSRCGLSTSNRSSERKRCEPRLVGTSYWISSLLTLSTDEIFSRAP
jgi:hypothetical protein